MYIIELYIVTMYWLHLLTLLSLNLLVRVELLRTFVSTKQRKSSQDNEVIKILTGQHLYRWRNGGHG
jgi:hypothetical protein